MQKSLWLWIAWFAFLLLLNFYIPFVVLADIPNLSGSFLFWVVWVLVAIISMFIIFLKWRDADQ
jgi:hypothetical protein